ncbi:MAG: class I SAM-dependent methyltransferase [Geminicoccaceae bacterium]
MRPDVFELYDFYGSRQGQLVRRLLNREIRAHWPDLKGQHVLGLGHATPFMGPLALKAERAAVIMPKAEGVMRWPKKRPNLTALGQDNDLPIADRSIDRVLIVHALEATDHAGRLLRDVWRILADDGEIIVIVPNRRGIWCLSEQNPFGQGRPYSSTQLKQLLRGHLFAPQKTGFALFVPPFRSNLLLKTAIAWERIGLRFAHQFAGALVMRAQKQIYAATLSPAKVKARRPAYAHLSPTRTAIAAEQTNSQQHTTDATSSAETGD